MANPNHAAIVLCGGQSRRMGYPKAFLPFGDETMLQRIVRIARSVVDTVVIVAEADQDLPEVSDPVVVAREPAEHRTAWQRILDHLFPMPPFPRGVLVTGDAIPGRGPLQGMLAGLKALPPEVDAAFVTSCDVPLLSPAFIERMLQLVEGYEVAVTYDDNAATFDDERLGRGYHPLVAVYRPSIIPHVEQLLESNKRSVQLLFDLVPTNEIDVEELVKVDPPGGWLINVNLLTDYMDAAQMAGITIPEELRQQLLAAQRRELR